MNETIKHPTCLHCGKKLRIYKYRTAPFAKPGDGYGDYGDGAFCGHTCGYQWATTILDIYTYNNECKASYEIPLQDLIKLVHLRRAEVKRKQEAGEKGWIKEIDEEL